MTENFALKPFSQACENNKQPILSVLQTLLDKDSGVVSVLEIGSGTGQHAVHFAAHMPHIRWRTSDLTENHSGIQLWIQDSGLSNVEPPITLDVSVADWEQGVDSVQAVYSANTCHIMPWSAVQNMFVGFGKIEALNTIVMYGPFKYGGMYTSDSNADFDLWLKDAAAHRGIRDFEAVDALAEQSGFELLADHKMPANNQLLVWRKAPTPP